MEKNLSYGDCFNFLGTLFGSLLGISEIEKNLDKEDKND